MGDRFIPNRNADNWEIQFYSNDNENRAPTRRQRDANGCLLTGPGTGGPTRVAGTEAATAATGTNLPAAPTNVITPPVAAPQNPQNNGKFTLELYIRVK